MSENIGQRRQIFSTIFTILKLKNDDKIKHRNIPEKKLVFSVQYFQT